MIHRLRTRLRVRLTTHSACTPMFVSRDRQALQRLPGQTPLSLQTHPKVQKPLQKLDPSARQERLRRVPSAFTSAGFGYRCETPALGSLQPRSTIWQSPGRRPSVIQGRFMWSLSHRDGSRPVLSRRRKKADSNIQVSGSI